MAKRKKTKTRPVIGWREWVELPDLGVQAIKAKVDTGARTSAIHAIHVEQFEKDGVPMVRFELHPIQKNTRLTVMAEAPLLEMREIRNSGGQTQRRPVIRTTVQILDERFSIDLTLARRDLMGFRMLLGREAVRRKFHIDPGRSFFGGRPTDAKKTSSA